MAVDILSYGYAAFIITGGIIGYVKAGSAVSLAMGVTFGSLAAIGAYKTSQNPSDFYMLLLVGVALSGVMGYRAFNSGKFMPAGLVASASVLMVVRLLPRLM